MPSKPVRATIGAVPEEPEPTLHPDDDCGGADVDAVPASEPGEPGGITHLPVETSQ